MQRNIHFEKQGICANPPEKQILRRKMLSLRKALPEEVRKTADAALRRHLRDLLRHEEIRFLVAYMTDGTEPDLRPLLEEFLSVPSNRLFLPRFLHADEYRIVRTKTLDFSNSKWGIPEPPPDAEEAAREELDLALWLVPGVAFDKSGLRLGRGKGIYDRLLSEGPRRCAGIFYECQRCDHIPAENHDRTMDLIVTENGAFSCGNKESGRGGSHNPPEQESGSFLRFPSLH